MNRKTAPALFAVFLLAGLPTSATAADQQQQQQQPSMEHAAGPSGQAGLSDSATRSIRRDLSSVLKSALDGDLEDLVDNFEESDRKRMANADDLRLDEAAIDRFQDKWNKQYGRENKITEANIPYMISASNRVMSKTESGARARFGGESSTEQQATVTVPAVEGLQTQVTLVDEGTIASKWRIDVPDNVSSEQLQQALNKAFNELNSTQLPPDYHKGAAMVAANVFKAINGQAQ